MTMCIYFIPKRAMRVQRYFTRETWRLYMVLYNSVQKFAERLNDLNRYIFYFPEQNPKQLDQKSLKFEIKTRLGILSGMKG
jgi:hypothetical protein